MKTSIICLSFLFISWFVFAHDFAAGIFDLQDAGDRVTLEIRLDKEDFIQTLKTNYPHLYEKHAQSELEGCMVEYIENNLSFAFDNEATPLNYKGIQYEKDFITISTEIATNPKAAKNIQVFNQMMVKEIDKQSNLVTAQLHGTNRTFRLHKERIVTTIQY